MRPTTILLTCGIAAGLLVPALILTDGATRPGYSLLHHGASQLGTGQRGWLQTVNFVIGGLLLLAFAAAGLALAVAGIVPTDPALGYPPGQPEVITAAGRVHGLAGLVLFATLAATPFVLARPLRGSNQGWVAYSRWSGALVIAFAIAAGVAFRLDVQGVLRPAPAGLLEHAALLVGFAWIIAAGLCLRSPNTVVQG